MTTELMLNDFAICSFRDQGDADYVSALMAFRAALSTSLWSSLQMLEKYLKCILLLNRIPAKNVGHSLRAGIEIISKSGAVSLELSAKTRRFIEEIDSSGRHRYLEISRFINTVDIIQLDRAAWELRRYCTLDLEPRQVKLIHGVTTPKVELRGGYLEEIINNKIGPARDALVWQNAFFGKRQRRYIRNLTVSVKATNAPLYLNPQMLDEVLKYVFLPRSVIKAYRLHASNGMDGPRPEMATNHAVTADSLQE